MKLVKKALMVLMMVTLIITLVGPVSVNAASVTSDQVEIDGFENVTTKVSLEIADEFTVTIPTDIVLTKITPDPMVPEVFTFRTDPSSYPTVSVKVTIINASKEINIYVSSENYNSETKNWTMTGDNTGTKIPYYLKAGTHIVSDDYVDDTAKTNRLLHNESKVFTTSKTNSTSLHALVAEIPSGSDNFYDTLTFTVRYEDKFTP